MIGEAVLDNPLITGDFPEPKPERQDDREAWRAEWDARVKKHHEHGLRPTHKIHARTPIGDGSKTTGTLWRTHNDKYLLGVSLQGRRYIVPTEKATIPERQIANRAPYFDSIMDALDWLVAELETDGR